MMPGGIRQRSWRIRAADYPLDKGACGLETADIASRWRIAESDCRMYDRPNSHYSTLDRIF